MISTSVVGASFRRKGVETTARSEAYDKIKHKIVTLELAPASAINEKKLAKELGLGLTPVRQALHHLTLDNLVVIFPRRVTMVADLNETDLRKNYEIRVKLEPYAAGLAATRASSKQIEDMESLATQLRAVALKGDPYEMIRADEQAHLMVAEATQNEFLQEILERLYSHVLRLWYLHLDRVGGLPAALHEHEEIIAAVKARDAERAETIMRSHVSKKRLSQPLGFT